jgi:hypothetical protein
MSETGSPSFKDLRHFVYQFFAETGAAPTIADFQRKFSATRQQSRDFLTQLHDGHAILKLPGADSVLMAWPFSNIPTIHRVKVEGRSQTYFGN